MMIAGITIRQNFNWFLVMIFPFLLWSGDKEHLNGEIQIVNVFI